MEIKISGAEDGIILRSFLKEKLGLSTHTVSALKGKENGIRLDGKHVTVRAILHEGSVLTLAIEDEEPNENLVPRDLPLSLLYEDEDITVCVKSGDMPTHPSHGHYDDTLANALAFRYRDRPYVFRAITRLDRETSGLVLTARHAPAAHRLSLAMREGAIRKGYLALVHGEAPTQGEINLPIRRCGESVILREVHPEGARAYTRYRRLFTDGGYSLLVVFPITGRTHQIRVHLSAIGIPLCGDCLYGREGDGFPRTMLHAAFLSFPQPTSGERLSLFAPPTSDLAGVLHRLGFPLVTANDFTEGAAPTALSNDEG